MIGPFENAVILDRQNSTTMQPARYMPACLAAFVLLFINCSSGKNQSQDKLGKIDFNVSGKAEAQPAFNKGLLLLHSFEYEDAAEAFAEARKLDKDFVMAYWGEAMTHNHPLWREQHFDEGKMILEQLAPTLEQRMAKAKTELERDFIKGVDILYGKGNKIERDSSYAQYMGSLYKKYPGNNEVAAFYSLSLIGWGVVGRQTKLFEQAATIANEVLAKNPQHPGALHYVIHAYDDPDHAAAALKTADKYSVTAPDAGHALHMPTHIYLALGLWDKVVSSNVVSWAAEKQRKERKNLDNNSLGYHSYHWLEYGYLQLGQKEKARAMVDSMAQYCTALPSGIARAHITLLKSTYLAETGDYTSDVTNITFPLNDLNIITRTKDYFVRGMSAYVKNDDVALDKIIRQIAGERLVEEAKISDKGLRVCGNVNRSMVTRSDLEKTEVMELQLKAMQAWLKKDMAATDEFLKKATALESATSYAYGPPSVVKPSFEMYGEWLLEVNKPAEALKQFELSLKTAPNKTLSVKGKQEAEKRVKSMALLGKGMDETEL
jgi:tetratricopeptide (TPR) repeat protein